MRTARTVVLGVFAFVVLSCSSVSPVRVSVGDQCFRCRRTIGDVRLAGEVIGGGFVSKFRAPGCMSKYLGDHPEETGTTFVTDYATGRMLSPKDAVFVPIVMNPDTGERDYRAYRLKTDADAAASELRSKTVDWQTVMARARS